MANVGALRTSISLDSAQFQQSMQGVNRQLKGLKAETRAATSSGTGFARGVTEMRSKAEILNRTLKVQDGQVKELRRRYEESRKATGENSKETQDANIAYQRAQAEMNKTKNQLKGITEEIERQTNPWNRLSDNMENAGRKLQDVGKGMTDFGKSYSMRVTAPVLGLGAGILKVGMDFEQGMSQVQALTQGTAEEMSAMSDQAKELGASTRFSATEAAEGMAFLGMAGWETSAILDGMPGLLSLAASANMELGRAADITSNIMAAFNIEAAEAGRVADILAHASSNSNTNVEQLGEAMKYVAPTANTLGLSIEDTAAAIMAVSDAGIQGSQAGRAFGTSLLRLADPTKAMKDEMKKLKVSFFDSEGAMKPLPAIIEQLEKGMDGYSSEQRAASLSTIFGTEAQRHWAIMLDTGSEALGKNSKELENSEGAAQNMADTMQDNAKGAIIEFKSALEGVGIELAEHMIPAVTGIVEKGTELVRKFGEMDESTQQNIIKMGLFAAAIGPVAIVLGSMTTAISGVVRTGGSLVRLLSGTGGLIARIGALGVSGPVGLAITGVGLLAAGVYALTRDKEKLHDINYDLIDGLYDEVDAMDKVIDRFDNLQAKNQLTNDEMLRYMDILDELEKNHSEETIKKLANEQENLLEKSGFTNEEMQEFLSLNDEIVENSPNTVTAISDQGNAYALTTDEVRKLNDEERERLKLVMHDEIRKALENEAELMVRHNQLLTERDELQTEITNLQERQKELPQELIAFENTRNDIINEIKKTNEEMLELDGEALEQAHWKKRQLEEYLYDYDQIIVNLETEQENNKKIIEQNIEKMIAKQEDLDLTEEELRKIDTLKGDYETLILAQADINAEKGQGLIAIDDQLKKNKKLREELKKSHDAQEIGTEEYRLQNDQLNEQDRKLKKAKEELENINELAKETGYEKEIDIYTNPSMDRIDNLLTKPVRRTMFIDQMLGASPAMYAEGTDNHPGGPFIAGEEGIELGRLGNRWELLNFGMYDRPRGYEVFTHDESKKILGALNRMPAYAGGVSSSGEANRVIEQLNKPSDNYEMITVLREQNTILMQLLKKENIAYVEFEKVYQPVKKRLAEDQYSNYKRRR